MYRLLLLLLLASPISAQETEEADADVAPNGVTESADPVEQEESDDVDDDEDLDELYSEEDEDAFIPSEDVKFGQSIPFPTDI